MYCARCGRPFDDELLACRVCEPGEGRRLAQARLLRRRQSLLGW